MLPAAAPGSTRRNTATVRIALGASIHLIQTQQQQKPHEKTGVYCSTSASTHGPGSLQFIRKQAQVAPTAAILTLVIFLLPSCKPCPSMYPRAATPTYSTICTQEQHAHIHCMYTGAAHTYSTAYTQEWHAHTLLHVHRSGTYTLHYL